MNDSINFLTAVTYVKNMNYVKNMSTLEIWQLIAKLQIIYLRSETIVNAN